MKNGFIPITLFFLIHLTSCKGQNNTSNMTTEKANPLLCDPEKGVCETPGNTTAAQKPIVPTNKKPLRIIYFTDPICSACWGIEPQLRKLKLEYGDFITIDYHMGGLLPSWNNYNSGPISGPVDVAHHWDEVSAYYEMPIDGDIWIEDPLSSSYPPSIAFKAAQLQDEEKAIKYLRRIREMVFLEKKNITKWPYLQQAALEVGLDTTKLLTDYNGKAVSLFQADLALGKQLGIQGFPSLFISNHINEQTTIYGHKPYEVIEKAIHALAPLLTKKQINVTDDHLFDYYSTLTLKEFSVLGNYTQQEAKKALKLLVEKGSIEIFETKNGALWKKKKVTTN